MTEQPTPTQPTRVGFTHTIAVTGAPATLRLAVWLIWLEAAGLAVLAAIEIVNTMTETVRNTRTSIGFSVVLALLTVLFVVLGRFLAQRRAGARNPAVALHLLGLPIGYYMIQGGMVVPGIVALAVCLVGFGLLISPPTRQALGIGTGAG